MTHITENKHFRRAVVEYREAVKHYRMGMRGRPVAEAAYLRAVYALLAGK